MLRQSVGDWRGIVVSHRRHEGHEGFWGALLGFSHPQITTDYADFWGHGSGFYPQINTDYADFLGAWLGFI